MASKSLQVKSKEVIFSVILIIAVLSFASFSATAQINQNNWLVGGSASYYDRPAKEFKSTDLIVSTKGGYFLVNKLALGLELEYSKNTIKFFDRRSVVNNFSGGPFARYYFLHNDNPVNILAEVGYLFSKSKGNSGPNDESKTSIFYFNVGPSYFINTSVSIELLIGERFYSVDGSNEHALNASVGFQIYLQKRTE